MPPCTLANLLAIRKHGAPPVSGQLAAPFVRGGTCPYAAPLFERLTDLLKAFPEASKGRLAAAAGALHDKQAWPEGNRLPPICERLSKGFANACKAPCSSMQAGASSRSIQYKSRSNPLDKLQFEVRGLRSDV